MHRSRALPAPLASASSLVALPVAAALLALAPGILLAQEGTGDPGGTDGRASGSVEAPPTTFRALRVEEGFEIDGVLDEPAWERAAAIGMPFEWSPGDNVPAPVETECRVAYDRENLYVGCLARDPEPDAIRAHLADRDTPFQDDHLSFLFDTFGDQRRAFQFRVNPYGVQMDALTGEGFEDFSWDAIWASKGRITDHGYEVEVAIPFESLNFPATSEVQSWGVILGRSYPRSVRHRMRNVPTDRDDGCLLCQAATLTGLQGMEVGSNVELNPTVTTTRTDARASFGADGLEEGPLDVDPGLNVRWGLTTNLTLDATLNPDFSQVEADVAQLETNRRFALFFPEKRPFFLEGADLFETNAPLVHTRTVVDPIVGAKFTGKSGGNAVGAFVTVDEVNGILFPGSQFSRRTLLDDPGDRSEVLTAVARYRRDIGRSSTVGALVTAREGSGYHNRLAAADADVRLSRSWTLGLQAVRSETGYPDSLATAFGQPTEVFGGNGYQVTLNRFGRNWMLALQALDVDEHLRADAGFLNRVGYRGGSVFGQKVFWGDGDGWFSRIGLGGGADYTEDGSGRVLERSVFLNPNYRGPLQTTVELELGWSDELFAGRLFSLARQGVFLRMQPSGSFSLGGHVRTGDQIDFANARRADVFSASPSVTWKAGKALNLELRHSYERLSLDGREIFTANLPQARVLYHLSVEAFFRAIVQYRHVSRNPAMYGSPVEEASQALFTQLLFSYELNPRTVLYAGYSDNRAGFTDRPLSGPDDRASEDLTQTDRTFFLKLGYAWRP